MQAKTTILPSKRTWWRCFTCWCSSGYWWVAGVSGALIAILGAWSQFPDVEILEYRPPDEAMFYSLLGAYILSGVFGVLNEFAISYKTQDIEQEYNVNLRYYKDTIFEERRESLNDHLREMAEQLDFGMQERICVYRFLEKENNFQCIGRYSAHNSYSKLSAVRKRYPIDHGIIAHVWNDGALNGFKHDSKIPDIKTHKTAYQKYLNEHYGIPRAVSKHFRMNPVDICAEVIRDTKNSTVAVIIFESQRRNFINEEMLENVYNDFKRRVIVSALDKLREQNTPDLSTAEEVLL